MKNDVNNTCPFCKLPGNKESFPYFTNYKNINYRYVKCIKCEIVFVTPIPDIFILKMMYNNETYHKLNYSNIDYSDYIKSIERLNSIIGIKNYNILDYGCGTGNFLKVASFYGHTGIGVEFSDGAVKNFKNSSGCNIINVEDFNLNYSKIKFDVVHLGDVLEHITNPKELLNSLIKKIDNDGYLYIEGPLERNASLVYYCTKLNNFIKKKIFKKYSNDMPPFHIYLTNAKGQKKFLDNINYRLNLIYWNVHETGWPYKNNGFIRNLIAKFAILISGKKFIISTFGNRFIAIYQLSK
jgi:SAM-dependent methyltransferase